MNALWINGKGTKLVWVCGGLHLLRKHCHPRELEKHTQRIKDSWKGEERSINSNQTAKRTASNVMAEFWTAALGKNDHTLSNRRWRFWMAVGLQGDHH